MNKEKIFKSMKRYRVGYLIFIPIIGVVAFLMNTFEGYRFISFDGYDSTVMIGILIAFTIIGIPLIYFISSKKLNSLNQDDVFEHRLEIYKKAYYQRLGMIGGNAILCVITYYGLNMPIILFGLPIYLLILIIDNPTNLNIFNFDFRRDK